MLFCSLITVTLFTIEGNPLQFTLRILKKMRNSVCVFTSLSLSTRFFPGLVFFFFLKITWAVPFYLNFSWSVRFFKKKRLRPDFFFFPLLNNLTRTIENYSKDYVSARMCFKLVSLGRSKSVTGASAVLN